MQRAVRCILRLPQNSEAAGEQMRRKVILFLAMSLDGYIADKNGKIDWLTGYDCHKDGDEIYQNFIKDVDTIVMGRKTYQQIVTELCPGQWVYRGRNSYIVTSQPGSSSDDIHFTQEAPGRLIKRLRREKGRPDRPLSYFGSSRHSRTGRTPFRYGGKTVDAEIF